ncbi:MAG TPA: HepT-like ribonuclease domain-containing protein [Acidimicrobiia bacterium]|nr:HepT-like ribonuclease domain-containing protein [Acidimicrobiia bacterium]
MQRDRLRLADVIEAAEAILRAVSGVTKEQFEVDEDLRDIVLWRFTKLGEAVHQLSAELRLRHSNVEWAAATAFRNRIVHGYFDIDERVVYDAASDDIPRLLDAVRSVVKEEFSDD